MKKLITICLVILIFTVSCAKPLLVPYPICPFGISDERAMFRDKETRQPVAAFLYYCYDTTQLYVEMRPVGINHKWEVVMIQDSPCLILK